MGPERLSRWLARPVSARMAALARHPAPRRCHGYRLQHRAPPNLPPDRPGRTLIAKDVRPYGSAHAPIRGPVHAPVPGWVHAPNPHRRDKLFVSEREALELEAAGLRRSAAEGALRPFPRAGAPARAELRLRHRADRQLAVRLDAAAGALDRRP